MRKLTKKISMLMVLAMLVGLFSGVVSASAASKWAFKSNDLEVAVGATVNLDQNQYENFDLYKSGVLADEATYTITWESSDADVVFVNAKTGQLRANKAAADGAEAVITANIVNNTNKADHAVSFNVVVGEVEVPDYKIQVENLTVELGAEVKFAPVVMLGEEVVKFATHKCYNGYFIGEEAIANPFTFDVAGEYTVTVGHFASKAEAADLTKAIRTEDFTVTVKSVAPEFVSAKQTALNTVEIVLNDAEWAAKAVADKTITFANIVGDVEIADLVKGVAAKADAADTIVVTLYNSLAADATYKFGFTGFDCTATVVGAGNTPASIKVVGGKVPFGTTGEADVKIFNAAGVDITTDDLKANVSYKTADDLYCDVTSIGDIYFFEVGKTAVIEATYDMGWNDAGEEITDLKASGVYTSVEEYTYSNPNGYAVAAAGKTAAQAKDLTYATSVVISLSDDYAVYAKYAANKYDGKVENKYICAGNNEEGKAFKFYSTNESVVLVNEITGELSPCKTGTASIYIKNADDKVVGSVVVTVKEARKLNVFTAKIDDRMLSTDITGEATYAVVSTKDQLGADYAANYSVELVSPLKDAVGNDLTAADFFSNAATLAAADGKVKLELNVAGALAAIADGKTQTVAFNLKATDPSDGNNVKSQRLTVSIKDMTGTTVANSTLQVSTDKVDTKLDKANADAYNVTIKLVDVDKDGYDKGNHAITFATTPDATTGAYTVVISKGDTKYAVGDNFAFDALKNEITIKPVLDGASISKMEAGTYKIQLFKGINGEKYQPVTTKYLTISDSTATITVVVVKDTIAAKDAASVETALEFYRNGVKIADDKLTVYSVENPVADIDGKYYVKAIKVDVSPSEMKGDSAFTGTFRETVQVNQLFKVN